MFRKSQHFYDKSGELNLTLAPIFEADSRDQSLIDVEITKEQTLHALMFVTELRFDQIERIVEAGISKRYESLVRLAVAKNFRSYFADQLYLKYGIEEKQLERAVLHYSIQREQKLIELIQNRQNRLISLKVEF